MSSSAQTTILFELVSIVFLLDVILVEKVRQSEFRFGTISGVLTFWVILTSKLEIVCPLGLCIEAGAGAVQALLKEGLIFGSSGSWPFCQSSRIPSLSGLGRLSPSIITTSKLGHLLDRVVSGQL